jgi:fructose-bisphosphate aldolase, class II
MLTSTTEMLRKAQAGGYAVGHFNTSNLEFTQAIIEAATELSSPVIVATSVKALEYAQIAELGSIVQRLAAQTAVPVALHLDHGPDMRWVQQCLAHGWTSIMIDASHLPYSENLKLTKEAVQLCRAAGIPVEAELGQLKGVEDWVEAKAHVFTDPLTAQDFVTQTGCSSLAVAIGTSHGAYKFAGESKLDFERLQQIRNNVSIPLVLHGASSLPQGLLDRLRTAGGTLQNAAGIPEEDIRHAISLGICKVNTDTELRLAFTTALREFYAQHPDNIDPRAALAYARAVLKEEVKSRILLFGSAGKA